MTAFRKFGFITSLLVTAASWAAVPQFSGVHRDLALPGSQRAVAAGDFNGDGKLDFAAACPYGIGASTQPVLIVALATTPEGYTYKELPLLANNGPGGVSAADVNGDGKLDLIVTGSNIQVFLGNGDGTFAAPIDESLGKLFASSQVIADFNGDGKPDLAIGLAEVVGASGVQLFWGNGDGTFTLGTSLPGDTYVIVATADFNGDSIPDLVAAGTSLSIYLDLGNGTFQKHTAAAPAGTVTELAIADFNDDHVPDVALSFFNNADQTSGAQVYLGAQNGTLEMTSTMTAPNESTALGVVAGDFDGDGKPDLVVLSWIGPKPTAQALNAVSVFGGNGDGTFGTGSSTPVGNRPEAAVAVDWNDDGKLDLIVSDYPVSGGLTYGISLMEGLGNRSFAQAPSISTARDAGTSAVAAGDFNGDGLPDVVTANAGTSNVSVFLNNGRSLGSSLNSPAGLPAQLIVVGDVNNDGSLDVVVAGGNSPNASVLLGKGNGTFRPPLTVPLGVGREPSQIAMADFNGDGNLDLVAVGDKSGNVYVSFGLGGGAFAPPVALTGDFSSEYVVVGDVNGDGFPDIVTSAGDGFIGEFLSKGNGTFSPYIQLQGYDGLSEIYLADVNGDGKLDLVLQSDPVTVSLGNGDGTFGSLIQPGTYFFGGGPLAIADFNGDGKLDIAVAPSGYNSVVILAGNGDGTFANTGSYAARYNPNSITTIDLNNDGRPDVISSNPFGISILPNATQ